MTSAKAIYQDFAFLFFLVYLTQKIILQLSHVKSFTFACGFFYSSLPNSRIFAGKDERSEAAFLQALNFQALKLGC